MVGDIVLVDARPEGGSRALEKVEVFQEKRHAGEGAVGQSLRDLPLGMVIVLHDHRVDLWIDLRRARDGFVEQLLRADLLPAHEIGKANRVVIAILLEGHRLTS